MKAEKKLMIVESPTKVKTLKKFLDSSYEVDSSYGHIMDLPAKEFGIKISEDKIMPIFKILPKSKSRVNVLKEKSKKANLILLATDPDREGEAISYHLKEILSKEDKEKEIKRVEFNEITKNAVNKALEHPRDIDLKKVKSQFTRRILDRIVGYKLSPLLWRTISIKGLSAGRVQSVALRLICDREEEINKFKPEEYWTIEAELLDKESNIIKAKLQKYKEKKIKIENESEAKEIEKILRKGEFIIEGINKKKQKKNPPEPLITSKLQQLAYNQLGFSTKKTMMIAQQLYEGITINTKEVVGLITYMRTDSTRISEEAKEMARKYIEKKYGKEYIGGDKEKKSKKKIQDAHEAIRPTNIELEPAKLKENLTSEQYKLYNLIWRQFLISQMAPAEIEVTEIKINNSDYIFIANGQKVLFDGYLRLQVSEEKEEGIIIKAKLEEGEKLALKELYLKQNFTQPPSRYTEATLVKTLEEKGIGRPSTYATIVSTIQERYYVEKENRYFKPTLLGIEVNKLMKEYFPEIVDVKFTANMESELDKIEKDDADWQKILNNFYQNFIKKLNEVMVKLKEYKKSTTKESGIKCEKCGSEMLIKLNKNGEYIACSNFPKCRNTKSITRDEDGTIKIVEVEFSDKNCPKCNGRLIIKNSKGVKFLACENYPTCKYTAPIGMGIACPNKDCDGEIIARVTKKGRKFYGCSKYPKCNFISWYPPILQQCPECGSSYLVEIKQKNKIKIKCPNKDCKYEIIKGEKEDEGIL
ncbi:MAG TPA: type I DNA topoisomerase [bacterium]|nr:type I DNA topoisomerase [bacterium]HOL47399.1 type I DNA topoisomerase [bacterium]HPQ18574.1 type I DNA topoisomerase [bacterium]